MEKNGCNGQGGEDYTCVHAKSAEDRKSKTFVKATTGNRGIMINAKGV